MTLRDRFINEGATIRYRCWGREGGHIFARFRNLTWLFRHESDDEWSRRSMSEAQARYFFPSDAELVESPPEPPSSIEEWRVSW